MIRTLALITASVGAALLAASCGGSGYGSTSASTRGGYPRAAGTTPTGSSGPSAPIPVPTSAPGPILLHGSRRTLYLFPPPQGPSASSLNPLAWSCPPG